MFVQTVIGSRFWLTRSSMIWGRLDSNMALHSASRVGEPITEPRVWQISLKNWTIWSSVVVSVMNSSMSVMMSTQMLQVSALVALGAAKVEATKAERRRANFILICSADLTWVRICQGQADFIAVWASYLATWHGWVWDCLTSRERKQKLAWLRLRLAACLLKTKLTCLPALVQTIFVKNFKDCVGLCHNLCVCSKVVCNVKLVYHNHNLKSYILNQDLVVTFQRI